MPLQKWDWDSSGPEVSNKTIKCWKFENEAAAISGADFIISMFLPKQEGGYEGKHHWGKDSLCFLS